MIIRPATIWLLLTLGMVELAAQPPNASDPWFRRSPNPGDFQVASLPWKMLFSVELPEDWQLVPGFAATLVTATEDVRSNEPTAAIVIEHTELVEPLGQDAVNALLAKLEADFAQARDPSGQNFEQQAKEVNKQRFVQIQYSRPGFYGQDRVIIYAIPAGRRMFRLICIAPENQMAKRYQAIFAHVASSFKPVAATAK